MDAQLHVSWREKERVDHPDSSQSDEFLIGQVRSGSVPHFGILYRRHKPSADRLARLLTETGEADDLVAEAFSQTLTQLLQNKGPEVSFRAYVLSTVRHTHFRSSKGQQRLIPTDDLIKLDQPIQDEDMVLRSHEDNSVRRAFESLPENWQVVLWHLEVERERPAQVAGRLGLSPNGVSALALRAREGLRQAYLRQHTEQASSAACRRILDQLPGYVRAKRQRRKHADVAQHLANCASCHAAYLELSEMNGRLGVVLAPALLGAVGWQYLSSAPGTGLTFLAHPWEWFQHHVVGSASHSAPLAAKIGISAVAAATIVTVVTVSQALDDPGEATAASVTDTLVADPPASSSAPPAAPTSSSPAQTPTSEASASSAVDLDPVTSPEPPAASLVDPRRPSAAQPTIPSAPPASLPDSVSPAPSAPESTAPVAPGSGVPEPSATTAAPTPGTTQTPSPSEPTATSTESASPPEPTPTSAPTSDDPTPQPEPTVEPTPSDSPEPAPDPQTTVLSVGAVAVDHQGFAEWQVAFSPYAESSSTSGVIDLTAVIHLESAAVLSTADGWTCTAPNPWGVVLRDEEIVCTLAWDVSAPPPPATITVITVFAPRGSITLSSDHLTSEPIQLPTP